MNAANLCPSFRAVAENVIPAYRRHRPRLLLQQSRQVRRSAGRDARPRGRAIERLDRRSGAGAQHFRGQQHHQWRAALAIRRRCARLGPESSDQQRRLGGARGALRLAGAQSWSRRKRRNRRGNWSTLSPTNSATDTAVLAITHVSNVSGIKLPVKELTRLAHERGIHVHLDGAQTWGAMAVDLRDLDVDSYYRQRPQVVHGAEGSGPALCQGVAHRRNLAFGRCAGLGQRPADRPGNRGAQVRIAGPARRRGARRTRRGRRKFTT